MGHGGTVLRLEKEMEIKKRKRNLIGTRRVAIFLGVTIFISCDIFF